MLAHCYHWFLPFYTAYPTLFYIFLFIIALCVGSFLNVVIYRLPLMLFKTYQKDFEDFQNQIKAVHLPVGDFNLCHPPSHCPQCKTAIGPFSNIPIFSFLRQKGRCQGCGTSISWRYPLVEGIAALLSVITFWCVGPTVAGLVSLLLVWALIALIFIDLDYRILPDNITLPLLWLGLFFNLGEIFVPLNDAVIGAIAGYLSLYLVYLGFKLVTGKEGMGFGDFKLLAAIGAWLGWQQLLVVIILSAGVGTIVGVGLIARRKLSREQPLPFGPFLAMGALCSLWFGKPLFKAYLQWIGLV